MEVMFEKSWEAITSEYKVAHGGLGSCLHKGDNGIFIAYARWPNRALWEKEKNIVNKIAMKTMKDCIEQSFPATPLEIVNDLLVR
ncbi:MAG: hypothetical protein ACXWRZ_15860 [Bdellovibrio sp.]